MDAVEAVRGEIQTHRRAAATLLRELKQVTNMIHQAHHLGENGGWRECQMASCLRAQDVMREYEETYG